MSKTIYNAIVRILISSCLGTAAYLILCFLSSAAVYAQIIPTDYLWILADTSMLLGVSTAVIAAKGKGKDIKKYIVIPSGMVTALTILSISNVINTDTTNYIKHVILLGLSLLVSFFLSIPKRKNSKLHKRRRITN